MYQRAEKWYGDIKLDFNVIACPFLFIVSDSVLEPLISKLATIAITDVRIEVKLQFIKKSLHGDK